MQNNTFKDLITEEKIIRFERLSSTNDYAKTLVLSKVKPIEEGTVIMADDQYAGKGQHGSTWSAKPGENLTFSIVLCPIFLNPNHQFRLNIAISLAIRNYLSNFLSERVEIKWPNDIYIKGRKIAGILIENILYGSKWSYSIIGIGININQASFDKTLPNATSLSNETSRSYDINVELPLLLKEIEASYLGLKTGGHTKQKAAYIKSLYRLGELHPFEINGVRVEGKIAGVNEEGKLLMDFNGHIADFDLKEIAYVT
ncbi:biotin--[acetyl-CoA-carboxylase] ligase [Olivibacter sitiensis]|uniref:biotin--[acetyl-CoA-carboxylase] ligase n=1 Tax=Olivibacter sitiensis TaxID=376470 RepID=UPI000486AC93|nr:biotin--[acetyl-CoA-carboxylase] ligase [Olivibacter sitiensis]